MQTITFRKDKQWSHIVYHRELYPVYWGRTWWKIIWGKKNVHICMTGSLCCAAEVSTTLYINYTLIKKFIKSYIFSSIQNPKYINSYSSTIKRQKKTKNGQRTWINISLKRIYTDVQQIHEKMLNIISH